MTQLRRVFLPSALLALLLCPWLTPAQTPAQTQAQAPQPRLTHSLADSGRLVLANSRSPRIASAQDLGALSPDTTIPGITLVFKRSAEQESALQQLLAAQQNTSSPLYHHWLTPETFAARFGIADDDIATTEAWLQSLGFHIDSVARSRDRITFSGTAAQVQSAFGTELHHYKVEGETHLAPASDLTLPTELASITTAIIHLSDFRPKPTYKTQSRLHPNYTTFPGQDHYLVPADIATMYDLHPLTQSVAAGAGQRLVVVGQSFVDISDIAAFLSAAAIGASSGDIEPVLVPNSGVQAISPGDEGESDIDLEYSLGLATNSTVFFVYVGANRGYDIFDSLAFAVTQNIAPVISISYGECEPLISSTALDANNATLEEAAAQGQTVIASAGDSGSTACAGYSTSDGVPLAQQQALAVNFPASSPYVTAVGGTQMAAGTFGAGANSYWAAAGGYDSFSSLLSYVPEVVWNEDSASNGISSGGGGSSTHFLRPTWQSTFPGMPTGAYRLLPDIALQSSIFSPGFLLCSSDPALLDGEGQTSSCDDALLGSNGKYTVAGGTSFAAPYFAAFVTILNGYENEAGQGNLNPILYSLAANSGSYAAAFHDITSGTNACLAVSTACSASAQSNYAATAGYDQATGLGSLDFNSAANAWPSSNSAGLIPTTTLLIANQTSAAPGETIPLQIYVRDSNALISSQPSGSVSISVDGAIADASLQLIPEANSNSGTSANYNLVAPSTVGSHLIVVTYPGDAVHSPSSAAYAVLVGNVLATGSISIAVSNLTVATGSSASTQVTVTPASGYNGRVVWSLAFATNSAGVQACYLIDSLPVSNIGSTSTTSLTIGIGTACNSQLPTDYRALKPAVPPALAQNTNTPDNPAKAIYATLLLCGLLATRRRKLTPTLLLALLSLAVIGSGLTGCGSGGSNTSNPTPTPSATSTTYSMTLTGKDSVNSTITASTTFTLTVN